MKKKIVFIFISSFFSCVILYPKDISSKQKNSNFHIDISPFFQTTLSKINESLYYSRIPDQKCSLLEYEQRPIFLFGAKIDFIYSNSIFSLQGGTALPLSCGHLFDSDWNGDNLKTTYSISDLSVNNYFTTALYYTYSFGLNRQKISPTVGADYSYRTFSARNTEGWYGQAKYSTDKKDHSWDSEYAAHFPDEKHKLLGLDYANHIISIFIGLKYNINFTNRFYAGADFYFSPYTYTFTKDHHLGNNGGRITYSQSHCIFKHLKAGLYTGCNLSKIIGLKIAVYGSYLADVKGEQFDEEMFISSQKSAHGEWNINAQLSTLIHIK